MTGRGPRTRKERQPKSVVASWPAAYASPVSSSTPDRPPRTVAALQRLRNERDTAWQRHRAQTPATDERIVGEAVIADPSAHDWRLVDAALERLRCADCGSELGAGPRGCALCDAADGSRFAAREIDPPDARPGNEHAIRVSSAVLRTPHRYPGYVVRGNELLLPLFLAGQMPRREQKPRLDRLVKGPLASDRRLERAATFDALLALVDDVVVR